jgi:hypothetical protein
MWTWCHMVDTSGHGAMHVIVTAAALNALLKSPLCALISWRTVTTTTAVLRAMPSEVLGRVIHPRSCYHQGRAKYRRRCHHTLHRSRQVLPLHPICTTGSRSFKFSSPQAPIASGRLICPRTECLSHLIHRSSPLRTAPTGASATLCAPASKPLELRTTADSGSTARATPQVRRVS